MATKSEAVAEALTEDEAAPATESIESTETETTAPAEPAAPPTIRELALAGKLNSVVKAPGAPDREVFVQHRFRPSGVLLTEDGEGLYGGPCKHAAGNAEVPQDELVYFEFVGTERDGERGFLHRKRGCQRSFLSETPSASAEAVAE